MAQEEFKEPEHKEVVDEIDPEYEKLLQTEPLQGLSDKEVEERLARFGKNGILNWPRNSWTKN